MTESSISPVERRMGEGLGATSSAPADECRGSGVSPTRPNAPQIDELLQSVEQGLSEWPRIDAELIEVAESMAGCDALLAALAPLLRGESPAGQHLDAYRAFRDAGVIPAEPGFFLVAHALTLQADARICATLDADASFQRLDRRAAE